MEREGKDGKVFANAVKQTLVMRPPRRFIPRGDKKVIMSTISAW